MHKKRSKSIPSILSLVLVGSLVVQVQPTFGRPAMITHSAESPGVGAPAQKTRDIGVGDVSFESPTGSAGYNYNFVVPPGRLGMQPGIGLAYSSQGSLRGGVAAGWSLNVPIIQRDLSQGSMGKAPNSAGHDDIPFMSSMSGGHQLVPVNETIDDDWLAYRAKHDDQYVRYERKKVGGQWRARTLDGKTWYFGIGHEGETDTLDTYVPLMRDGISGEAFPVDDRQPLTRVEDRFGNTIRYFWIIEGLERTGQPTRDTAAGMHLKTIRYSENFDAGLASHARVEFEYQPVTYCSATPQNGELPIGASLDFRGGSVWYSGRHTLDRVETFAMANDGSVENKVRRVQLGITSLCPKNGGSIRQLDKIEITNPEGPATNAASLAPPMTFGYGDTARSFASTSMFDLPSSANHLPFSTVLSGGWIRAYDNEGEPSLEQTLLDFDGDGRLDMLVPTIGTECSFDFLQNTGTGFNRRHAIAFPSERLEWENSAANPGEGEGCTLSARRTKWTNRVTNLDCDEDRQYGTYLTHRFIDMNKDGLPDLVTAIRVDQTFMELSQPGNPNPYIPGVSEVLAEIPPVDGEGMCLEGVDAEDSVVSNCFIDNNSGVTQCCKSFDMDVLEPNMDTGKAVRCGELMEQDPEGWENTGCGAPPRSLEVGGQYPWMVYYNTGDNLDPNGQRVWSPIPLDPAGAESSIGGGNASGSSSTSHAILDINGDGVIDALAPGVSVIVQPITLVRYWQVFAGSVDQATGKFLGFESKPYFWIVPDNARTAQSGSEPHTYFVGDAQPIDVVFTSTMTTLVDVNADGLPDLVRRNGDFTVPGLSTSLNTGSGFCNEFSTLQERNVVNQTAYDHADLMCMSLAGLPPESPQPQCAVPIATTGSGESLIRLVDIDGDGLLDYYDAKPELEVAPLPLPATCSSDDCASVKISGAGGGFQDSYSDMKGVGKPISRHIEVTSLGWGVWSDFMDLDGDGLDDIITISGGDAQLVSEDTSLGKPLRLLNKIDNGQGLVTDIEYQPYNETTASAMPAHVWVVSKVTTRSKLAEEWGPAPDSEVLIQYENAVYNKDYRGNYGFRGFGITSVSSPHALGATSGFAVTQKKYNYSQDYSGRLTESAVFADGFAKQQPHAIDHTAWKTLEVAEGASKSFVAETLYHRICDGLDYASCASNLGTNYHSKEFNVYRAQSLPTSGVFAYVPWHHTVYEHGSYHHKSVTNQTLYYGKEKYWSMVSSVVNYDEESAVVSKSMQISDTSKTFVQHKGVYGTIGGVLAVYWDKTGRSETGQIVVFQDPNDRATGAKATAQYSGYAVQATSTSNELEQTTTIETDLGTGQTLRTQGPNALDCNPSERAGSRTTYDALGRPTALYEIGCYGGTYSDSRKLSNIEYVDFKYNTGIPAHVITTSYQEEDGPRIINTIYVDGAGRTVRTVANDGTTDGIVSTSEYNAKGQLIRSTMPNPDTASLPGDTVDSSYSYDSLGRTVAVRQAPSIDGANATGVNISYSFNGTNTIQEVSEHVMSGPAATTTTYSDFFGRMVQVDESRDGATAAQTLYEYDGNDNVKKITDADGVITEMEHDWDSRRTKVIRGEREWTYAYDKNGNMIRETSPNPNNVETADNPGFVYTTQTVYDELDRPTSRILATAGHDSATLDTFDAREVGFTYDSCANGIGQLCMVTTGANLTTNYVYDYAGRVIEEHQDIELPASVADFAPESRVTYMSYNLGGAVTDVWLADGSDEAASTHMSYSFDALGSP